MPKLAGLIGPSYKLRYQNADVEEAINCFCERIESGAGKEEYALLTAPGYLAVWSLGSNARIRGMFELNGHVFAVVGNQIYDFLSDGMVPESWQVHAQYGSIADDGLPVTFAANRDSLVVVSAGTAYQVFNGALSTIAWLPSVLSCGYLNTFFVFLAASQDGFYYSEPDDPATGDILNFVSAEASANNFIRLIVDHQQVILFGNKVSQFFETTGDPDFPFTAIVSSGVVQYGIESPFAVVQADNNLFWLGVDNNGRGMIWHSEGYTPLPASDQAVTYAIQQYAETDKAVAWSYQEDGHLFIVFSFPEAGFTWVKDLSTGFWHRRAYWNATTGRFEAHRGYCAVAAFGNVYIGDRENGKIYRLSLDYTTDNGDTLRAVRRSPDYAQENKLVRYDRIEIVPRAGFGGDLVFRFSNNNGYTWSPEYVRSTGATGNYDTRVFINGCGMGRNRVFELSWTGRQVLVAANFNGEVMDY